MATQAHDEQLGKAWELHRSGKHGEAMSDFERLIGQSADSIDAIYGRGLAQRAAGQLDAAQASFEETLRLARAALEAKPGEDRFEMLERMSSQRLSEIRARR